MLLMLRQTYLLTSYCTRIFLSSLGERLVRLQHPRLTMLIYLGYNNCSNTLII